MVRGIEQRGVGVDILVAVSSHVRHGPELAIAMFASAEIYQVVKE